MTKDLANIDETRRALLDLGFEVTKWQRVMNQLNNYYDDKDEVVKGYHDIKSWLEKVRLLEKELKTHLKKV